MHKHHTMKLYGISFTEVVISIFLIAILVVIGHVTYKNFERRKHYTVVVKAAEPFKKGVQNCFQLTGSLTNCLAGQNGVPNDTIPKQYAPYISRISIDAEGIITIQPKARFGIHASDTYVLTPKVNRGVIKWVTSGGSVEEGYAN